jgi:hypothetical protein
MCFISLTCREICSALCFLKALSLMCTICLIGFLLHSIFSNLISCFTGLNRFSSIFSSVALKS